MDNVLSFISQVFEKATLVFRHLTLKHVLFLIWATKSRGFAGFTESGSKAIMWLFPQVRRIYEENFTFIYFVYTFFVSKLMPHMWSHSESANVLS